MWLSWAELETAAIKRKHGRAATRIKLVRKAVIILPFC
jgi:hypothetical protein